MRDAFGQDRRGHRRSLVRAEDLLGGAFEDLLASQHAVHDAAERVEIRCRTDERRLLADLLGRDPADRACTCVHRELGLRRAVETRVVTRLAQPRETEVEDVRTRTAPRAREIEHHVRGLEIAVDDVPRVRMRHPREHLIDERPDHRPRHRGRVHPLVDAAPGQRVHHEVRRAVVQRAEVARAHDRGMLQRRDRARLLLEPPALLCARRLRFLRRTESLQCDTLVRDDVLAQVDDPHAPSSELPEDLVTVREDGPNLGLLRIVAALGRLALRHRVFRMRRLTGFVDRKRSDEITEGEANRTAPILALPFGRARPCAALS